MIALCHKCWTSGIETVIDFEISQNPLCLACYEKRPKNKIKKYQRLLAGLPPRKDIVIDAMISKMKGLTRSEDHIRATPAYEGMER